MSMYRAVCYAKLVRRRCTFSKTSLSRGLSGSSKHDLEALRNTLHKRADSARTGDGAVVLASKSGESSRGDIALKEYADNSIGSPTDFVEPRATKHFNNALSIWAILAASGLLALWFLGPAQAKQQQTALHVSARELRFLRRRARKAMLMCCKCVQHARSHKLDVFVTAHDLPCHADAPTVLCYAGDGETASSWGLVAALLHPHARVLCVARLTAPHHDCRLARQGCASQAADMEYACRVAGVSGPVITITSGPSSFASALFQARAASGAIAGVSACRSVALDPQWMPDTLRSRHVPAVVAASRQMHEPGLLERLQLPPQQRERDDLGRLTPTSVLGKGLHIAQRITGDAAVDSGRKGDSGVQLMKQQQPILTPDDVSVLREVLSACPQPLHSTQLLTAPDALPYNVSAVNNAQVFTLRANGAQVLAQALRGSWGGAAAGSSSSAVQEDMRRGAEARRQQLQQQSATAGGAAAVAASIELQRGDVAAVAGLRAVLRPVQSMLALAGSAAGLLPASGFHEVQQAEQQLKALASEDEVYLVQPAEANVYHTPLQLPGAVLQAVLPHLQPSTTQAPAGTAMLQNMRE